MGPLRRIALVLGIIGLEVFARALKDFGLSLAARNKTVATSKST